MHRRPSPASLFLLMLWLGVAGCPAPEDSQSDPEADAEPEADADADDSGLDEASTDTEPDRPDAPERPDREQAPPSTTPPECLADRGCTIPLISAHRGLCGTAPENTIAAFLECQAAGVPMVELDTRETADGVVVIMHDSDVDRTTDGEERFPGRADVDELTLAEFKSLVISAPGCAEDPDADPDRCRPPTFRESLERTADWLLFDVDFKSGDPAAVARVLLDTATTHRALFFDSNLRNLRAYLALVPDGVVMPRATELAEFEALLAAENADLDLRWIHGDPHNIAEVAALLHPAGVRLYVNAFEDVDLWFGAALVAEDLGDEAQQAEYEGRALDALDEMRAAGGDCFGTDFGHRFAEHFYPDGFGR